ncbi:hypothetical protein AAE478_007667 [Parahypoxylon ruwenzoriense]
MGIEENFEFNVIDYRNEVRRYSTQTLKQQEIATGRKMLTSGIAVGAGLGSAYFTGGLTLAIAAYKCRSTWVAKKKHEIIQAELLSRKAELHHIDAKDIAISSTIGAAGILVGVEIGDFAESLTNTEAMGSGLADGANKSTGLTVDPGMAAHGAVGQIEQLFAHVTGEHAAAAIPAADAVAYHAGMVQAQILEEHLGSTAAEALMLSLAGAPEKPRPKCARAAGVQDLSCDRCREKIKPGECYLHCCICSGDNYDVCLGCAGMGNVCKNKDHKLRKLLRPMK